MGPFKTRFGAIWVRFCAIWVSFRPLYIVIYEYIYIYIQVSILIPDDPEMTPEMVQKEQMTQMNPVITDGTPKMTLQDLKIQEVVSQEMKQARGSDREKEVKKKGQVKKNEVQNDTLKVKKNENPWIAKLQKKPARDELAVVARSSSSSSGLEPNRYKISDKFKNVKKIW